MQYDFSSFKYKYRDAGWVLRVRLDLQVLISWDVLLHHSINGVVKCPEIPRSMRCFANGSAPSI